MYKKKKSNIASGAKQSSCFSGLLRAYRPRNDDAPNLS